MAIAASSWVNKGALTASTLAGTNQLDPDITVAVLA